MTGRARHRDAKALRRALERMGELYRRAGGELPGGDGSAVRAELGRRLAGIAQLSDFSRADLAIDLDQFVPQARRRQLEALPAWVEIAGERCPVDYEVADGVPTARIRLRERTARQLRERELPDLGRSLGFTVLRGKRPAVRADTIEDLRRELSAAGGPRPPRPAPARRHRRRS